MKIRDVLRAKGNQVYSIDPQRTVREALALLVGFRVGALLVVDTEGHPVGIISERDVLRECITALASRADRRARRDDDRLPSAFPRRSRLHQGDHDHNRVCHLPIVDGDRIAGLVSIGDAGEGVPRRDGRTGRTPFRE
jgi:CBS domain-containing protein